MFQVNDCRKGHRRQSRKHREGVSGWHMLFLINTEEDLAFSVFLLCTQHCVLKCSGLTPKLVIFLTIYSRAPSPSSSRLHSPLALPFTKPLPLFRVPPCLPIVCPPAREGSLHTYYPGTSLLIVCCLLSSRVIEIPVVFSPQAKLFTSKSQSTFPA